MVKKSCLVGILAIVVILLSSLGPMAAPVTIEVWHKWNPGEPMEQWLTKATVDFEKATPNIKVDLQSQGRQLVNKVRPRFIEGNPPDVIETHYPNIYKLVKEGVLYCLDDFMATNVVGENTKWKDTFIPQTYKGSTVDGKMYMVPTLYNTAAFFYHVKIFKKYGIAVPETWDDLLKACDKLKKNGVEPIAVDGGDANYSGWWFILASARLLGPEYVQNTMLNKPGTTWSNPAYLDAAKRVQSLARNYFIKGFEGSQFPAAQIDWATGRAAMMYCGSWLPNEMSKTLPADRELGAFKFPGIPGGKGDSSIVEVWTNGFAIPKDAKRKAEAAEFLKFITSKKTVLDMLKYVGDMSCQKGTPVVADLKDLPGIIAKAADTIDLRNGATTLATEWEIKIYQPLNGKLLFGELTPEDFIAKLSSAHKQYYESK